MAKVQGHNLKNVKRGSELFRQKQERRKLLARLPVETKLKMVEQLRDAGYKMRASKKAADPKKVEEPA